jgi:hypothetical protein
MNHINNMPVICCCLWGTSRLSVGWICSTSGVDVMVDRAQLPPSPPLPHPLLLPLLLLLLLLWLSKASR